MILRGRDGPNWRLGLPRKTELVRLCITKFAPTIMNTRTFGSLFAGLIGLVATSLAVKVDSPEEAERGSSHVVSGTVLSIYTKITRDASYEWTRCVAAVRVDSVAKGEGIKAGDLIYVRYTSGNSWIGKGDMPPGPGPHENVPAEGDRRKICLIAGSDGGWDVYYVSGFKAPLGK